ncbi:MAG: hypothetical protein HONDAALG_04683 [Gammaproteobacteria bacterium]|nr:hypothetical protein [Gammaproteobacteria bacterium]
MVSRVGIAAVLVLVSMPAGAWTDPNTRAPAAPDAPAGAGGDAGYRTLADVRRVIIQILGTNSREWERYGFTDEELRRAITGRLQARGIEVVAAGGSLGEAGTALLEVDVHVNDQAFLFSYQVFVRLKEKLPLSQNPQAFVTKTVWSDWKIGGFEAYNFGKLRAAILELVDRLLASYEFQYR